MHYMYGYLRSELSRNMVKGMYSTLDELARLRLLAEMIIASCPIIQEECLSVIESIRSMEFGSLKLCNE